MAKFTKLNIGDAVASSGGRVWRKLNAESAEEESIVGTWVFNETITPYKSPSVGTYEFTPLNFEYYYAGSVPSSTYARVATHLLWRYYSITQTSGSPHFDMRAWSEEYETALYQFTTDYWYVACRTIKILTEPDDEDFSVWLKANATKQGAKPLISFTIAGTSYQAEEGMTWAEWCESDYRTDYYWISGAKVIYGASSSSIKYVTKSDGTTTVNSTEVIESGYNYRLYITGGGSGN